MFNPQPKPDPRPKKKPVPLKRTALVRSKEYKIPARSKKETKRMAKYRLDKEEHLKLHPTCQVPGCEAPAYECHHPYGRIGFRLYIFMSICRPHHDKAELDPKWAKENGVSASRLNKGS